MVYKEGFRVEILESFAVGRLVKTGATLPQARGCPKTPWASTSPRRRGWECATMGRHPERIS